MNTELLLQKTIQNLDNMLPVPVKLEQEAQMLVEHAHTMPVVEYTEEEIPELARLIYQHILESEDAQSEVRRRFQEAQAAREKLLADLKIKLNDQIATRKALKREMKKRASSRVMRRKAQNDERTLPEQLQYNQTVIESMRLEENIAALNTQQEALDEEMYFLQGLLAEGPVRDRNKAKKNLLYPKVTDHSGHPIGELGRISDGRRMNTRAYARHMARHRTRPSVEQQIKNRIDKLATAKARAKRAKMRNTLKNSFAPTGNSLVELSRRALGRYIPAAANDQVTRTANMTLGLAQNAGAKLQKDPPPFNKEMRKFTKREKGIRAAVAKLMNNYEPTGSSLMELSTKTLRGYKTKALHSKRKLTNAAQRAWERTDREEDAAMSTDGTKYPQKVERHLAKADAHNAVYNRHINKAHKRAKGMARAQEIIASRRK